MHPIIASAWVFLELYFEVASAFESTHFFPFLVNEILFSAPCKSQALEVEN